MAGVKAPSKTCQLFQLMCWPQVITQLTFTFVQHNNQIMLVNYSFYCE